jgi:hypothetical protein
LGLEGEDPSALSAPKSAILDGNRSQALTSDPASAHNAVTMPLHSYDSLISVEKALKVGDVDLAQAIVQRMRERAA